MKLEEQNLFGSSRLGMYTSKGSEIGLLDEDIHQGAHHVGLRRYEFSDHLGNVHLVLSDRRPTATESNVIAAYEYYPFGMMLQKLGIGYRYGFNGKERDGEFHDNYDFGARLYDPSLARFFSVDPDVFHYPALSPYNFALNTPIYFIDADGRGPRPAPKLVEAAIQNLSPYIFNSLKAANNTSTWHANEWARGRAGKDAEGKMTGAIGEALWLYRIAEAEGGVGRANGGFYIQTNTGNIYGHGTQIYGSAISKVVQIDVVEIVTVGAIQYKGSGVSKEKQIPKYDANGNRAGYKALHTEKGKNQAKVYALHYEVKTLDVASSVPDLYAQLEKGVEQAIKNGFKKDDMFIGILVTDQDVWKKVAADKTYGTKLKALWKKLDDSGNMLRLTTNLSAEAKEAKGILKETIKNTPEK